MTQEHPITPPPDLVRKWAIASPLQHSDEYWAYELYIAHHAARWGADQELEACLVEIRDGAGRIYIDETKLRVCLADDIWTARRPHPPSLKEQALIALETWAEDKYGIHKGLEVGLIHRALEQLDD